MRRPPIPIIDPNRTPDAAVAGDNQGSSRHCRSPAPLLFLADRIDCAPLINRTLDNLSLALPSLVCPVQVSNQ